MAIPIYELEISIRTPTNNRIITQMKLKTTILALSSLVLASVSSNAASMIVTNVSNGPGDTLYALNNNSLLDTGLVTMGYFIPGITQSQIDTIPELKAVLSTPTNYITVTSSIPGAVGSGLSAGYASGTALDMGSITGSNALIGRTIYSIILNQGTLADFVSNASSITNQVALVNIGLIKDDVPDLQLYSSNPQAPAVAVIGSFDTLDITDDSNPLGNGTYSTLKMAVVPEPSAALLGALGALGFLRRRRN
jgi:MYXO-CTERM domain-containing protein